MSSAWASYLQEITDTVIKQMAKHDKSKTDLENAEAQWRIHLQTASAELVKLSDSRPLEETEEDASMEATRAWDALAATRKVEQQAQQQQLLNFLREASQAAAVMATAVKREGSRTPRRTKRPASNELTIDSSPDMKEDEATVQAKLAAPLAVLADASPAPPFK